jgi:hypothetical protein
VEVAPPPRDVEFTRVHRGFFAERAKPPDKGWLYENNGVEWRVTLKVRRLVSSGRDVIDFDWSIVYTGPRHPLIILQPSLTESWPGATKAHLYAFPAGSDVGRRIVFETPDYQPGGIGRLILDGSPRTWFLTVRKGRTATGTDTVSAAEVKKELLDKYPTEFSETRPPKLYAEFTHDTEERGLHHKFDAWTGFLQSAILDVPDLKKW